MDRRLGTAGRVARYVVAITAFATAACGALLIAVFRLGSSPTTAFALASPGLWALLLAMPVALATLPPLSQRLRGGTARWLLLPLALVDLVSCSWFGALAIQDLAGGGAMQLSALPLPALVPNAICAVDVLVRVGLPRTSLARDTA